MQNSNGDGIWKTNLVAEASKRGSEAMGEEEEEEQK